MSATTVNSILTVISILCTIASAIFAHRAKEIKRDVFKKLDTIDLIPMVNKFGSGYARLSKIIKSKNVNPASEEGSRFLSQATDLYVSLNTIIPKLDKETQTAVNVKRSIVSYQLDLSRYGKASFDLNAILAAFDSIDLLLRGCADRMKKS